MDKYKLLLAEDDENLGKLLNTFLEVKGYQTELVDTGKKAVERAAQRKYDFIILDVMMPEMDGFEAATEIRSWNKDIPILFLTAKSLKEDKLKGFNIGADDYLTKPFSMEELLARLQAILKRTNGGAKSDENRNEKLGDTIFDLNTRMLTIADKEIQLTTKEAHLLNMLIKSKDDHLDRQVALRAVWGDDNYFNGRSMDVYITKLRKILKDDPKIQILNVHGKGFKLIVND
jgi:two-component system, OmpR family, response regulator